MDSFQKVIDGFFNRPAHPQFQVDLDASCKSVIIAFRDCLQKVVNHYTECDCGDVCLKGADVCDYKLTDAVKGGKPGKKCYLTVAALKELSRGGTGFRECLFQKCSKRKRENNPDLKPVLKVRKLAVDTSRADAMSWRQAALQAVEAADEFLKQKDIAEAAKKEIARLQEIEKEAWQRLEGVVARDVWFLEPNKSKEFQPHSPLQANNVLGLYNWCTFSSGI